MSFHNEKTPSFTVYPILSLFIALAVLRGGDAIGFIKRIENLIILMR
jgi:DNA primase